MTSANRRLESVPDSELTSRAKIESVSDTVEGNDDWDARTIVEQWAPEHQLIGALMHLRASRAKPILNLVPDTAIWQPVTRWSYELIRGLVDGGRDPNPVVVLRRGYVQSASEALDPEQPVTPRRYHALAVYLANAYTQVVDPRDAHSYAREVLDDAFRRALHAQGIRMAHMAETGAERVAICKEISKLSRLVEQWTGVSQTDIP